MAYTSGTAANYKDLLSTLATFAAANGWTILTQSATELYLRGEGTGGLDKIYCGIRAFEESTVGYYNWQLYGSVFWKSSLAIGAQPLTCNSTFATYVYLWNSPIPYWLVAHAGRIILVAKVGSTFQHVYLGFALPVGTAAQYPYPLVVGGTGSAASAAYSTTDQSAYWNGQHTCSGRLFCRREHGGRVSNSHSTDTSYLVLNNPDLRVFSLYHSLKEETLSAPSGTYLLEPLYLLDLRRDAVFAQLDGVFRVSGYQNTSENIITVGGVNYMVFQDTYRSTYADFCALRLN